MPTTHFKFTRSSIANLPSPTNGQRLYRDTLVRGLGVRVGQKARTFFAEGHVGGRTRRVTIGRADIIQVDDARKEARELLVKMARGKDPVAERRARRLRKITLNEAFRAFFSARAHLSPRTVDGYRRTCQLYLADWRTRPLTELTRTMVLSRHKLISEQHGAVTANNVFRHLRSVFNFTAATTEGLTDNPVQILTQARVWHREAKRRRVISLQDLPSWWAAVQQETEDGRDILLMALFTGMRRSEILGLRWENLDLAGGRIALPKTKNGDPLELPLPSVLRELLLDRAELVRQSEWVFPGRGKTGRITEIKTNVARVTERSGVRFGMHDLRRTFITIAESLDIPAYALKQLLNHRSDSDVTGGYIVITVDRLRQPMERIAQRIMELAHAKG